MSIFTMRNALLAIVFWGNLFTGATCTASEDIGLPIVPHNIQDLNDRLFQVDLVNNEQDGQIKGEVTRHVFRGVCNSVFISYKRSEISAEDLWKYSLKKYGKTLVSPLFDEKIGVGTAFIDGDFIFKVYEYEPDGQTSGVSIDDESPNKLTIMLFLDARLYPDEKLRLTEQRREKQ